MLSAIGIPGPEGTVTVARVGITHYRPPHPSPCATEEMSMKSNLFVTAFCIGVAVVASGQALAQTTQTTQTTRPKRSTRPSTAKSSATRRDT